jgi:hypothetical protein
MCEGWRLASLVRGCDVGAGQRGGRGIVRGAFAAVPGRAVHLPVERSERGAAAGGVGPGDGRDCQQPHRFECACGSGGGGCTVTIPGLRILAAYEDYASSSCHELDPANPEGQADFIHGVEAEREGWCDVASPERLGSTVGSAPQLCLHARACVRGVAQ